MATKLTDRVFKLLGLDLDLDFSVSFSRRLFNPITDDLYLGARPEPAQLEAVEQAGITHVVSCLREDRRPEMAFLQASFDTLFIPMRDGVHEDIASAFPLFFDYVRGAQERGPAKVLIHCEAGVSRSATLTIALLMQRAHKRFFETYCDVRAQRQAVLPNIGFASQLQRLEFDMHPQQRGAEGPSSLARYLKEVCNAPVDIETLESMLQRHDYNAFKAIESIFGGEIPRVVQGVRL